MILNSIFYQITGKSSQICSFFSPTAAFFFASTGARRYPLSYVYSGVYFGGNGNLGVQNTALGIWSSTPSGEGAAYDLHIHDGNVTPQNNTGYKYTYSALRCISPCSTSTRRYPLSYVYSGGYLWSVGDGRLDYQGTGAQYYSSTAVSDIPSKQYMLMLSSSSNTPQYGNYKIFGFPLRFTFTRRYPLSYVYAGRYTWSSGTVGFQNQNADWWTATAQNAELIYRLFISDGSNTPQDSNYRDRGFSLRFIHARRYPLSYVLAGSYTWEGGNTRYQNVGGDWYSSTAYSSIRAYGLAMSSDVVKPQGDPHRLNGATLR
ncbi:hypothetical protein IK112_02790 [Candidatus Saccharibacteria bacterium]|nr:hypothetical protein [Candidatus Saccharibacteria bacterium]